MPRTLLLLLFVAPVFASGGAAAPPGAKVLFYSPASGDAASAAALPSPVTGLTPVGPPGTVFVGLHYWFENDHHEKFVDAGAAAIGSQITLHLRANTPAFLTVWMSDATHASVELTPRTDAGPQGAWSGHRLGRDRDYVVNPDFSVAPQAEAAHVIMFLARSQTEQVDSFQSCRDKLARITQRVASDGASVIAQEVDRTTAGQIGTYVVHRTGGQTGAEIVIGR